MLRSLRLRLLVALIGIPVAALVSVGIAMHYANNTRLDGSVKFRVIPDVTSRGTGLRSNTPSDTSPPDDTAVTIVPDGQPVVFDADTGQGYVVKAPPGFVAAYEEDQAQAISALNQRLTVAVAMVALIAAAAAFGISRRVLGPVESLTTAARRLEDGDLRQRVSIRTRDEIGQLGHAFNSMAETLEQNEALRKTLTSDIAHELRTPLNNISGYLDAVADGVVEADERTITSLQEEAQLLIRLVTDLEQLSLADAGHQRLHFEQVAVEPIVRRAVELLSARAASKGVTVATNFAPGTPCVSADAARLGQVVRNLLENAVTHTPEGGRVSVRVCGGEDGVNLTVADTGTGIGGEHLPLIFERFYRADPSRTRSTGGAGLGLAIVKQLVEAHGGSVEVSSEPGEGAVFGVRLPAAAE